MFFFSSQSNATWIFSQKDTFINNFTNNAEQNFWLRHCFRACKPMSLLDEPLCTQPFFAHMKQFILSLRFVATREKIQSRFGKSCSISFSISWTISAMYCACINLCSKNHLPAKKTLCSSMQFGQVGRKPFIQELEPACNVNVGSEKLMLYLSPLVFIVYC